MRIDVVGRNIEISQAIREYAETKAAKLPKYFDGVQLVTFRLTRENAHHTSGFECELVIDVEKHADFVSHATGTDAYEVIDLVLEKGERQLRDFKERLKN